jgi:hypothetical protein
VPAKQHWATYDPVALPNPDAVLRLLRQPARWPDIASAAGRFTALRPGGLLGQTFEIEVIANPATSSARRDRTYSHGATRVERGFETSAPGTISLPTSPPRTGSPDGPPSRHSGPTPPARSMLAQLATVSSTSGWDDQPPATMPDRPRSDSPQPR